MGVRNPPWIRDELILALDLYSRLSPRGLSHDHPEVIELSRILNRLPIHTSRPDGERFRNPNGVYMKMCNFLRLDPTYSGTGLQAGSKLDAEVWAEFAGDRRRLASVATAIRAAIIAPGGTSFEAAEDEDAPEGRLLLRLHQIRERNQTLVRKKKALAVAESGRLACEGCGFDFQERYGDLGLDITECHCTIPASQLKPNEVIGVGDLALVCPNCHRMLHRGGELLTVELLRQRLNQSRAPSR